MNQVILREYTRTGIDWLYNHQWIFPMIIAMIIMSLIIRKMIIRFRKNQNKLIVNRFSEEHKRKKTPVEYHPGTSLFLVVLVLFVWYVVQFMH